MKKHRHAVWVLVLALFVSAVTPNLGLGAELRAISHALDPGAHGPAQAFFSEPGDGLDRSVEQLYHGCLAHLGYHFMAHVTACTSTLSIPPGSRHTAVTSPIVPLRFLDELFRPPRDSFRA
ncbi:hypothetical protein [Pelomicrobium methylotrophicum]|uniref:Uncharacterized protein n=1 Tax=Pelomicrobium methylotrophicum TaxID=2602750 RepID=A0A5C7EGQ3_9PROT|nr:hypothetical protein [Pelomicrobium methylotrophicum]TXF10466.1 hypothetical protein FR698_15020 [Pelomicrobium methylotrophicum]